MVNPAEDIVNIWLQETRECFTMSNIVVPKATRKIMNRNVGGGRGKEIDLIATNIKGEYFWVEVSVSPSPRLSNKKVKAKEILDNTLNKFAEEKELYLKKRFGQLVFHRVFVYSPKMFPKKSKEEENQFIESLKVKGIEAKSFSEILKDVYDKLNYMGYDITRNYLFLLKRFSEKDA